MHTYTILDDMINIIITITITIIKTTNLRNGSEVLLTGSSLCLRYASVVAAHQVQAFAILKKYHHVTGVSCGRVVVGMEGNHHHAKDVNYILKTDLEGTNEVFCNALSKRWAGHEGSSMAPALYEVKIVEQFC